MSAKAQVRGRRRALSWLVMAMIVLAVSPGCASTGSGDDETRGSRDVLTREQLAEADHLNAYDAIRRYRSLWLRSTRGQDSFVNQGRRGLRVYVDDVFFGSAASLRDISVAEIQEIRFLDKRKATTRFGGDHAEGAILITTR